MDPIDVRAIPGLDRDHDAVTDGGRFAVEGPGEPYAGAPTGLSPCDEGLILHHPADADFFRDGIVKGSSPLDVVGSEGDVTDHEILPPACLSDSTGVIVARIAHGRPSI
jgi:hypothetical protein